MAYKCNQADMWLAVLPLLPPLIVLARLLDNPIVTLQKWIKHLSHHGVQIIDFNGSEQISPDKPSIGAQLVAYVTMAVLGCIATSKLVPTIKHYTLRKGISGKDLGKKGTPLEDEQVPEALGIVPGAVFLVCLIFCLVGFAAVYPSRMLDVNSALLSICFMLFLGFTDDALDWPWRYKLFLPSVASLPLLCCYNGSTSVVVPIQLRRLLWTQGNVTSLGDWLGYFVVIDSHADGSLINLGYFYFLYMGMLAVFCTNAINIFAGINGLEAGQSYVIGCAVLLHNLIEIEQGRLVDNHLFSVMVMLSFVGVTFGLLQHNWYPASVFVGDTYCYFAGMTFACVGILGHFSKTLLLFFIPQVLNFIYSTPQLFRFVPCPRHRLPRFDPAQGEGGLMYPSTFPCKADEYKWLWKVTDTQAPNMTVINLCLQILGPMTERNLCLALLGFQVLCCAFGFACRYYVASLFFE